MEVCVDEDCYYNDIIVLIDGEPSNHMYTSHVMEDDRLDEVWGYDQNGDATATDTIGFVRLKAGT